jgi:retron-type reverse transcriptase
MQQEESPSHVNGTRTDSSESAASAKAPLYQSGPSYRPHHIDAERLWHDLCHVPHQTAPGSGGQTVDEVKQDFGAWSEVTLRAVYTQGYRPPPVRRTSIPKPGKREQRPLGVPCVGDRVLQCSVADVLSALDEQDFLPCSFGGRPGVGAHHALPTLHEVSAGKPVSWVYEADLRNFFGSLDHGWLLRFVQHRVGDPRMLRLIRRWLKAGVLEDGVIEPSDEGVPQGGVRQCGPEQPLSLRRAGLVG